MPARKADNNQFGGNMEQENKDMSGFPKLDLHDLKDVWRLGNMARAWAERPVALGPEDMTLYMETAKRYGLEPAEVLLEFQKMAYGDPFSSGPHAMPNGDAARPSPEPRQPRHEADGGQQSGDLGWRPVTEGQSQLTDEELDRREEVR